jgi:CRP-like cAMP-binding protein
MLHAQYEGKWTGNTAEIDMFCTHQDIANFTASRRQTVSTIIRDLVKERKIIYKGRSKLIIPDIKKLHA